MPSAPPSASPSATSGLSEPVSVECLTCSTSRQVELAPKSDGQPPVIRKMRKIIKIIWDAKSQNYPAFCISLHFQGKMFDLKLIPLILTRSVVATYSERVQWIAISIAWCSYSAIGCMV